MNEYEIINHLRIKHMNLFLVQLTYRTPHYHNELELGFVLNGALQIKKSGSIYQLKENDIFVLNTHEIHELSSETGALVLSIQLSYKLFSSYYPSIKACHFLTLSLGDCMRSNLTYSLQRDMLELAQHYLKQEPYYEFQCISLANQLLYSLLTHAPHKTLSYEEQEMLSVRMNRIHRITGYIDDNFNRKLLLSEIAEREHLTLTYLSHFIKDMLGMSFQDYLSYIRFHHAIQLIESTRRRILDISLESGFSDVRYLNQMFTKHYGCSPKEYRKNHTQKSETMNTSIASLQRILLPEESLLQLSEYRKRVRI